MFNNDDILIPIENLKNQFINNPYYFFTEEDVRSFLMHEFYKRKNLNELTVTEDRKETIAIHSEVRWYKYSEDQDKRTDIVIIDPTDLHVTNLFKDLPSKCYGFNKYWAAIELKFRRNQSWKTNQKIISEVSDDLELLRLVRIKTQEFFPDLDPLYFTICFDRGNDLSSEMDSLKEEFAVDNVQLIYINNK